MAPTTPIPVAGSLRDEVQRGATRFREWVEAAHPDNRGNILPAIDHALETYPRPEDGELPTALLSDAASAYGEILREKFGGEWIEDDLTGVVLSGSGGIPRCRLLPLSAIERKAAAPDTFSLEKLTDSLAGRLEAEKKSPPWPGGTAKEVFAPLAGKSGNEAQGAAQSMAQEFRDHWAKRHGAPLPLSLMGVRQLDQMIRTHYFACFLTGGDLLHAGVYLGEVGRGLFEGEWDFTNIQDPHLAPLRYPELDYYPIGRLFKMLTTHPEGEPLDEYLRLIPSARKELRDGGGMKG